MQESGKSAERTPLVHSKVMAGVGVDLAIEAIEPTDNSARWNASGGMREAIHVDVCVHGFSQERKGSPDTTAVRPWNTSALLIAVVGFLPPDDVRVTQTIGAIERNSSATEGCTARGHECRTSGGHVAHRKATSRTSR
jgi:GH15 family glucan-1,4-alpha-glucosidase